MRNKNFRSATAFMFVAAAMTAGGAAGQTPMTGQEAAAMTAQAEAARLMPLDSKRGKLEKWTADTVTVNGTEYRLSPGFWLKNKEGRIAGREEWRAGAEIWYKTDTMGQMWRMWLL